MQFYVIYVPDLTVWDTYDYDYTKDHKDVLVALQATLNLCLYTYYTNMMNGVTNTIQISKETDLDWQIGGANSDDGKSSFSTVMTTLASETCWMSQVNVKSFNWNDSGLIAKVPVAILGAETDGAVVTGITAREEGDASACSVRVEISGSVFK